MFALSLEVYCFVHRAMDHMHNTIAEALLHSFSKWTVYCLHGFKTEMLLYSLVLATSSILKGLNCSW